MTEDQLLNWLTDGWLLLKVIVGFSIIIFVHELGHFLAAKWMGVRVDRFAVGFLYRVCGYRRGEGFTFGKRPEYKPDDLAARGWGETDYCINALPFGGYVKMMGEDDIIVNEQTGEMRRTDDPRAFANKPVGRRMVVVSAGVFFNLLFAVLLYMFVFLLLGKQMVAPVLGRVEPATPAANAGLLPGDRVTRINGAPVESFEDIYVTSMLSSGPLRFEVERDGRPLDRELVVDVSGEGGARALINSLLWMVTTTVARDIAEAPDSQGLRTDDQVTQVDGVPVSNVLQILTAFERSGGRPIVFTVERKDPQHAGALEKLTLPQQPALLFLPASEERGTATPLASQHLLGLLRRWEVDRVDPGGAADRAGFKRGDVIIQWGTVVNPLFADIPASLERSDGRPVPVVAERGGQPITLNVTARRPFRLFGTAKPQVGLAFTEEQRTPVVADVAPDTPAAALGIPRGAQILAIGAKAVQTWSDVLEAFKAAAGTTVAVRYRSGPDEVTVPLNVPSSIVNELSLPASVQIRSIGGEDTVPGTKWSLPSAVAVRKLLERNMGRTVTVEYVTDLMDSARRSGTFTVRADNVDPWQLRAEYTYDLAPYFARLYDTVTASGNPVRAFTLATQQTSRVLWSVYRTLQSMVSPGGNVSMRDVSGPVGIVRAAVQQAETSQSDLLFFLAYISVNLAVINFVPLPVVDGGLMVFLILEKLRGRPLGLKIQVVTTLVGLGLIVLCFVLVTFQDIVKWATGGM